MDVTTSKRILSSPSATGRYARGYLGWYQNNLRSMAEAMFLNKCGNAFLDENMERFKKEKFHFAKRIQKTYPDSIPELVLIMKMRGFLKEVAEQIMVEKTGLIQPEFDFMKEMER